MKTERKKKVKFIAETIEFGVDNIEILCNKYENPELMEE